MYSCVHATGHIKDPVPLIEKGRGLSPGGRFPPSFIHQPQWDSVVIGETPVSKGLF